MTTILIMLCALVFGVVNGFAVGVWYAIQRNPPSLPVEMVRPALPWERKKRRTFGLGK